MFLGIDISKLNFDAALLDPSLGPDAKPRHRAFPNTPAGFERLQEWLGGRTVHACLEATGTYGDALARSLHESGHTVSVVNPAQIKAFAGTGLSRAKTDKADAILIARFCRMHRPPAWTPPAPQASELQALVRRLESLGEMRQMEQNRLDVTEAAPVRSSIEAVLSVLDEQIETAQRAIRDRVHDNDTLRGRRDLLVSIPGIAEATAASAAGRDRGRGAIHRVASGGGLRRAGAAHPPVRHECAWAGLSVQGRLLAAAPRAVLPGDGGAALQPADQGVGGAPAGRGQVQDGRHRRGDAEAATDRLWRPEVRQGIRPGLQPKKLPRAARKGLTINTVSNGQAHRRTLLALDTRRLTRHPRSVRPVQRIVRPHRWRLP